MRRLNSKGQIGNLAPAILALIFAAVVLVMGLVIQQELRDTRVGTVTSASVVNESVTLTNTTGQGTISRYATNIGFGRWNASQVFNVSGSNVILVEGVGYQINSANGTIFNKTSDYGVKPAIFRVTYTYTWGDEAFTGSNATVVGLGAFADFWEIIVLAIVISIVIGLLLTVFGGRRER